MPYTLGKVFVWYILAGLVGVILGWMLHHLLKCSQKGHGAPAEAVVDTAEVDRLKARIANLEPAVQDRDNLRRELATMRVTVQERDSLLLELDNLKAAPVPVATFAAVSMDDHGTVVGERDALRAQLERHTATIGAHEAQISTHKSTISHLQGLVDAAAIAAPVAPALDAAALARGGEVLGHSLKLDDLKVVEGIGPRIEELCYAKDIRTWWGLANTDESVLRSMLDEAGPRFQMHEPASWPRQARLLANGLWQDFKELTDRLDGGREVE